MGEDLLDSFSVLDEACNVLTFTLLLSFTCFRPMLSECREVQLVRVLART